MKKRLRQSVLWALALALLLSSGAALAQEEEKSSDEVHFVLVLDCTGSMDEADVEGMSVAAAELFVDMLPMENATISVLCFGKQWKNSYAFKNGKLEEMQPFLGQDGAYYKLLRADSRYINALCELDSLTTVTERSELKSRIEDAEAFVGMDSITIASSAMLAAIDLLKSTNVEPSNACIVLMSDGRVQYDRREAMDAVTSINPYPCYVLELNYDQKNTESSIAREQLVDIAAKYDGDQQSNRYIEVKSAGDVILAVSAAIGRFIDLQAVNPTKVEVVNGESEEYEFFVPEMASETNIVVTGQGFQKMQVTLPDGSSSTYDKTNTVDPDNTFIRNENKYAVLKIKRPAFGTYRVKVFASSDTNIYIHAVSAKELNLVLRASGYEPDSREYWLKNDVIPFTAALEYEGNIVPSQAYYTAHPAELTIKNQNTNQQIGPLVSTAGVNGYCWSVPLQEAGALEITAFMPSDDFRDGGKTSNALRYAVKNLELTLGEGETLKLPERMYVNEQTGPIDVSSIFVNPDCDQVSYSVVSKNQDGLAGDMVVESPEQGVLTLRMPSREGEYRATLSARDANMQQPISIDFSISVENRPIQELKKLTLDTIVMDQPKLLGGKPCKKAYDLNEYYNDPDGLPLTYALTMGKTDHPCISILLNGSQLLLDASETGNEKAKLTVTDSSGDSKVISLNAKAENWLAVLISDNLLWIFLAIFVLIIVIVLLGLRRVKGGWFITISGPNGEDRINERFSTLTSQKSLKKPVISLISILRCADSMNDDETVNRPNLSYVDRLYPKFYGRLAGNRVTVKGLDAAHTRAEVRYDGVALDRRRSKIVLTPGHRLDFQYSNGMDEVLNVTLEME